MIPKGRWLLSAVLVVCSFTGGFAQYVSWRSTTAQNPWVDKGLVAVTDWDDDKTLYLEIDDQTKYQVIDGWGGALNEYGWIALSVLPATEREKVLRALFDTSECAINLGRVSMGANDFSTTFYSCDDSPNDFTMANFSLAKDKVNVIPYALGAKAVNPDMKFWGSPHSPPAWMKQNNNMVDGSLKTDDATRKAYALYFQKWVQGMATEGVPIYAVHVQNEPNISGVGYPCCLMSGAEMGLLIKNYIGPQFKTAGLSTEIWVGTMHSAGADMTDFYPEYIPPTLGDSITNGFISGVGMQWNAITSAERIPVNYPSKKTMQTETECGNFKWQPDYKPDFAPNEWEYGMFTLHRMLQWLRAGVNAYCQWNMVLDETGKSNSTIGAWPQNSMISIDKSTRVVRYNPQYYAVKHFSRYVKPGAFRIATGGNFSTGGKTVLSKNIPAELTDGDMMAFLNPDGDRILVLRNVTGSEKTVAVRMGSAKFKPTLPANSINTFRISNTNAVKRTLTKAERAIGGISVTTAGDRVLLTMHTPSGTGCRQGTLTVFNAAGSRITTTTFSAATNRIAVSWDGAALPGHRAAPGMYFARITVGEVSETCRVIRP
jgi:glucosylceramidase